MDGFFWNTLSDHKNWSHILSDHDSSALIFFFLHIYLFVRDTERKKEREAESQAEGGAGSMQGAWGGTWYRVSRIKPWAEGDAKLLSHQGCPLILIYILLHVLRRLSKLYHLIFQNFLKDQFLSYH